MYQFPDRLKELMIEQNLSQHQLGRLTNISQASIARWLADIQRPSIDNLIILADYFKCSIDYLVGRED